ncbi:MAG TPA: hypothetical protein VFB38_04135 [Chthonomonadaceae bacterium]|nr:hypothetical protein [Chthonomonadaceae bacterium]
MTDNPSEALTDLGRLLQEQLARKDERIAMLEALLEEAQRQTAAASSGPTPPNSTNTQAPDPAMPPPPPAREPQVPSSDTAQAIIRPYSPDALNGHAKQAAVTPLPDLGPQIDAIADVILATAASRTAEVPAPAPADNEPNPTVAREGTGSQQRAAAPEGSEPTLRMDSEILSRGHAALAAESSLTGKMPRRKLAALVAGTTLILGLSATFLWIRSAFVLYTDTIGALPPSPQEQAQPPVAAPQPVAAAPALTARSANMAIPAHPEAVPAPRASARAHPLSLNRPMPQPSLAQPQAAALSPHYHRLYLPGPHRQVLTRYSFHRAVPVLPPKGRARPPYRRTPSQAQERDFGFDKNVNKLLDSLP